jgi:predicted TIM-barrel fold metal-dependent hydrolase
MQVTRGPVDARVEALGYRLFDADNHYYEAEDAFLRHMDSRLAHKAPRWVRMPDGKKRLIFGDRMNRFLGADHAFEVVARAGILSPGAAGHVAGQDGELVPTPRAYKQRDARLAEMDAQGLEATLLFPTLGVSVEQLVADDVEATYANLHAFNLWLDEDWGFNHQERIHAVPLLSLLDPFLAVEELEFVASRGARTIHLRLGPVAGRSPADRIYDRFWAAVAEANVAVTFHAADDSYRHELGKLWGWGNVNVPAVRIPPLQRLIAGLGRPCHDTIAALIHGRLFERFPTLRMATVELGSDWVPGLLRNLERAGRGGLAEEPLETFRRHIWVNAFSSEDLAGLADLIGIDRILFGSDYPHTDGLREPADFMESLKDFAAADVRRIMRDNARELVGYDAARGTSRPGQMAR